MRHRSWQWWRHATALLPALAILPITLPAMAEVASEGTFKGRWSIEGRTSEVLIAGERVAVYRMSGPVTVESTGGLERDFESVCVGASDKKTGGVARCSWLDADGDGLFLQLEGRIVGPEGTVRESYGTVIAGSGKYRGLEGAFEVDWLFLDSAIEKGKVIGKVTSLSGSWRRP